ncbi:MAG: gamma-glutamyltransferase [Pseudomonadota bacterium]
MRNYHLPGRSPTVTSNAMVATSHPLAASEALDVLRSGGNAVDAAIAGAVLLGVCEPHMCGIGGDCFALVKPAGSNQVHALNGSGRAPAGMDADALRAAGLSKLEKEHPASVTIPGGIDGLCRLSERFGKLGLERNLAPAIRYFEQGVPVAPRVAHHIAPLGSHLTETAKDIYLNNGKPLAMGDTFALPGQAEVLRRIARDGRDAFYTGEIAEDMVAALNSLGGTHTVEDFATTEATWTNPIMGPYRGHDIVEHPPNGQGVTALLLCDILAQFDLASMDPNSAERLHIEAEATKLAYDARNRFLADPDYMTRLDHLLSLQTAQSLAALIDPRGAMAAPQPLTEDVHKDTVLITAVDADGMAVSLIYSIFASFGSGIASPEYGILLHNRGSGFNLTPGHPNEAGPGKRPMHTILPAMRALDGTIDMTFGVMGGQYQATGHAHFLANLIDYGMDPQEAIDAPRAFADPMTGLLQVEDGVDPATCAALEAMGHRLDRDSGPIGGAQAIQIDHARGVLIGGSDPRKDGLAIGY